MVTKDFWVLLAMVIYFVAMLTIGFIYSKRSNSSTRQYFAGGRGVGPWLTALSAEASDMSGWLLMGLPGVAYFTGAADPLWTALGLALGTYLNWSSSHGVCVATPWWQVTRSPFRTSSPNDSMINATSSPPSRR